MKKIKEIKVHTFLEAFEKQNSLIEENDTYTFRIAKIFPDNYILEVYQSERDYTNEVLREYIFKKYKIKKEVKNGF